MKWGHLIRTQTTPIRKRYLTDVVKVFTRSKVRPERIVLVVFLSSPLICHIVEIFLFLSVTPIENCFWKTKMHEKNRGGKDLIPTMTNVADRR